MLFAMSAVGCYRYVPGGQPPPTAGADVRVHITQAATGTLASTLGADVALFDAKILSDDGASYRFAMQSSRTRMGRITSWSGELLEVPRAAIERMEARVIDRPRTIRATIVAVVGGVAVGLIFKGISSSGTGGGGRPPPPGS